MFFFIEGLSSRLLCVAGAVLMIFNYRTYRQCTYLFSVNKRYSFFIYSLFYYLYQTTKIYINIIQKTDRKTGGQN